MGCARAEQAGQARRHAAGAVWSHLDIAAALGQRLVAHVRGEPHRDQLFHRPASQRLAPGDASQPEAGPSGPGQLGAPFAQVEPVARKFEWPPLTAACVRMLLKDRRAQRALPPERRASTRSCGPGVALPRGERGAVDTPTPSAAAACAQQAARSPACASTGTKWATRRSRRPRLSAAPPAPTAARRACRDQRAWHGPGSSPPCTSPASTVSAICSEAPP